MEKTERIRSDIAFCIKCNDRVMIPEEGAYLDEQGEVMVRSDRIAELFGISCEHFREEQISAQAGEEREVSCGTEACRFRVGDRTAVFAKGRESAVLEPADGFDSAGTCKYMYLKTVPVQKEDLYIPVHYLAAAMYKDCAWNGSVYEITDRESREADTVIYLTRHGKTLFNQERRVQGWCDSPLTEEGERVARSLGKGLLAEDVQFAAAYSGDLGRQRQTARIILEAMGQELQVKELFGLREVCFGDWEGEKESVRADAFCKMTGAKSIFELYEKGELVNWLCLQTDKSGQAETDQHAFSRMLEAMEQIAKENRDVKASKVLAVTSGGVTVVMMQKFGAPGRGVDNAAVTYFECIDGVLILGKIGDTHFLENTSE